MLYAGQTQKHVAALPQPKFNEVGHEELLFTERDSQAAWKAIGELCMPLDLYTRLHEQATVLNSFRAKFLINAYLQANRDATPGNSDHPDLGPVNYFQL